MNARTDVRYTEGVGLTRWGRRLGELLLVLLCTAVTIASARADAQDIPTQLAPIVYVLNQGEGHVVIHTANVSNVRVDGDDGFEVKHAGPVFAQRFLTSQLWLQAVNGQTADGPVALPPEPFPIDLPGDHEVIFVHGTGGNVDVTIPQNTAFLVADERKGEIDINDYHGTFKTRLGGGQLHLNGVSGTGAVEMNGGALTAERSTFDRLRVRTIRANMFFNDCTSRQIEATSVLGSIVYDSGEFQPGLARFESQQGNVAIGVARGGAQIAAHSDAGRVFSEGDVHGGPTVTATSGRGTVLFYNGSLRAHPALMRQVPAHLRARPPAIAQPIRRRRPPV